MDTPVAKIKNVSIIKVENGYVVTAVGKSYIARDAEEVKTLVGDKVPDVITALDKEEPEKKE